MIKRFECWRDEDDDVSTTFAEAMQVAELRRRGLLAPDAAFLYAFEAGTWFDAMSEHYRRQGWAPYVALDESVHEPLEWCPADLGYPQTPERRALDAATDAYDGTKEARKQLLLFGRAWLRTLPRP